MYLRHTTRRKDGKTHVYWQLVRSVRRGRKLVQQTVAQLGELDAEGRARRRRSRAAQRRAVCGTIKAMEFQGITRESLADLLRSHGIAPTRQRIEIAHVLFERKQHLSAEQILAAVNARHAETSKATVYNTLRLFLEKRLVRELIVDPTRVFYDPNTSPHHHFYDVVTGLLTDIPAEEVRITGLPALPPGTVADGVDVIIRTRPA